MAATVAKSPASNTRSEDTWGRTRIHRFTVTLDSSYTGSGGEAVDFGIPDIANCMVFIQQTAPAAAGYVFQYDRTNKKLIVFWVDTTVDGKEMLEVAATTSLATVVVDVLVIEP